MAKVSTANSHDFLRKKGPRPGLPGVTTRHGNEVSGRQESCTSEKSASNIMTFILLISRCVTSTGTSATQARRRFPPVLSVADREHEHEVILEASCSRAADLTANGAGNRGTRTTGEGHGEMQNCASEHGLFFLPLNEWTKTQPLPLVGGGLSWSSLRSE